MTNSPNRYETGRRGEAAAAAYLLRRGYTVRARNYRCPFGELDLVAEDGQTGELVFVEVRARGSRAFGSPEESITAGKAERLTRLATHYVQEHWSREGGRAAGWRIDVIAIEFAPSGQVRRLDHYQHAIERRT
jgi:putative endonuclease